MIIFPSIAPTTRSFKDAIYPDKSSKSYAGVEFHRPLCSVPGGYELTIGYKNIDQAEGLLAYNSYLEAKGNFEAITLPTEIFRGMQDSLYWRVQGSLDNTKWYCNNTPVKTFGPSNTVNVEFTFINYAVTNANPFIPGGEGGDSGTECSLWNGEQFGVRINYDYTKVYEGSPDIDANISNIDSGNEFEFLWRLVDIETLEDVTFTDGPARGTVTASFVSTVSIPVAFQNPIPIETNRSLLLLVYTLNTGEYFYSANTWLYIQPNRSPTNTGEPAVCGQQGIQDFDIETYGNIQGPRNLIVGSAESFGVFGLSLGLEDDVNWSLTAPDGSALPTGTFTPETELSGTIPLNTYVPTTFTANPITTETVVCFKAFRVSDSSLVDSRLYRITGCILEPDLPPIPEV